MEMIDKQQVLKLPQRKGYAVNGWETYIRVSDIKELSSVQSEQELRIQLRIIRSQEKRRMDSGLQHGLRGLCGSGVMK